MNEPTEGEQPFGQAQFEDPEGNIYDNELSDLARFFGKFEFDFSDKRTHKRDKYIEFYISDKKNREKLLKLIKD